MLGALGNEFAKKLHSMVLGANLGIKSARLLRK